MSAVPAVDRRVAVDSVMAFGSPLNWMFCSFPLKPASCAPGVVAILSDSSVNYGDRATVPYHCLFFSRDSLAKSC